MKLFDIPYRQPKDLIRAIWDEHILAEMFEYILDYCYEYNISNSNSDKFNVIIYNESYNSIYIDINLFVYEMTRFVAQENKLDFIESLHEFGKNYAAININHAKLRKTLFLDVFGYHYNLLVLHSKSRLCLKDSGGYFSPIVFFDAELDKYMQFNSLIFRVDSLKSLLREESEIMDKLTSLEHSHISQKAFGKQCEAFWGRREKDNGVDDKKYIFTLRV